MFYTISLLQASIKTLKVFFFRQTLNGSEAAERRALRDKHQNANGGVFELLKKRKR